MTIFVRRTLFVLGLFVGCAAASAQTAAPEVPGLVVVKSPHSVAQTVTQLKDALETNGLTVIAEVDHSANAESVGLTLPPTYLVIFGNPDVGTPLMQERRTVAIDLPQKMLVWEDAETVYAAYNDPAYLAERHGLDPQGEGLQKVAAALANLAKAATAP